MDEWDDLKFILAVSRSGSLSGASRTLRVNHATVSRRIAAAEARLGVRLFDRLPSGISATPEGAAAVRTAERIEAELDELGRKIVSRDSELRGEIRVTAPNVIIKAHLADVFADFCRANPDISLVVKSSNELLNLHRRQAEVAIRVSKAPDPSLFGRRATGQSTAYYASAGYMKAHATAFEKGGVIDYIGFSWWGDVPDEIQERFAQVRMSIQLDDMAAVLAMVKTGLGVGRLPCILGETDPDIARVPGFTVRPYSDVWVLTHPDLRNVARIRLFMRHVAAALSAKSDVYLGTDSHWQALVSPA